MSTKIIRTEYSMCPKCNGEGFFIETNISISVTKPCCLCNGSKLIISATERELLRPQVRGRYTQSEVDTMTKELKDNILYLEHTLDANQDKVYTKKEVDAIRKEAFGSGFFKGWYNGCFEEDKTYSKKIGESRYQDYLSSLNLNTKDTGKDVSDAAKSRQNMKAYSNGYKMGYKTAMKYATNQPTNDNAFVWTDELAVAFAKLFNSRKDVRMPEELFPSFKQSKQPSPPIDSKDYEILCFVTVPKSPVVTYLSKNPDGTFGHYECIEQDLISSSTHTIHSVKRLSDGKVFSVGDEVKYISSNYGSFIITNFFVKKDGILARSDGNNYCEYVDSELIKIPPIEQEVKIDSLTMESRAFYAGMDGRYKTFSDYKQKLNTTNQ